MKICRGRPCFKGMAVHQIMAHTFLGYKPGYDVHHKDENKLNNALSNLIYLTRSKHCRLHATELLHDETRLKISAAKKGKHLSEEIRAKMSAAQKGKILSAKHRARISAARIGKYLSEETRAKISASMKGRLKTGA